ncbi:hypothetical protein ES707_09596 [subsurface metagenome]
MKIRDTVLDDHHGFITPALTWTFPINIVDPVTEFKIDFQIETHPLGGIADDWFWPYPMPYMIKEIAIIDGSEVIFALNGAQAFAMSCFDLGYAPYHRHEEKWGEVARWCFPIHFGRNLTDPEWIFDPKKFRNPQIRITWDSEWRQDNQQGTYKVDSDHPLYITVWAKIMEEGARPRGYLMTKEVKEYTPTGVGDEITWLPVDFPIRKLMVRAYLFEGQMHRMVNHLKLSQDQDKWIPFDLHGDDFIRLMKNWFTEVQMHGYSWVEDAPYREHLCGDLSSGVVISNTGSFFVSPSNWWGNTYQIFVRDFNGMEPAEDGRIECSFHGTTRTPLDCFCYPFGDQDNASDWLQTSPMGNLRLILTHGLNFQVPEVEEGSEHGLPLTQIVCQQAHPY